MMRFVKLMFWAACGVQLLAGGVSPGGALAGVKEDAAIDKMIAAYGGDALLELKTLRINDRYKGFRAGQSVSPDEIDLSHYNAQVTIDFENRRKALQWVRGSQPNISLQHQIFDGKKGYFLNHTAKTLTQNEGTTYTNADRRVSLLLDTVLARVTSGARDKAVYKGEENYRGAAHEKILLQADGFPEMTLYIDAESGRISKMQRAHWVAGRYFNYQFSDYRQQDGITYANSTYVTRGGKPFEIVTARSVTFNPDSTDVWGAFTLPVEYGEDKPTLAFSEMAVKKLAEGVYLAGKNWGFSIFVDAGDYFIAAGGYEGLKDRFEAMKAFAGVDKPLKLQLVSHHHIDHLGGMKEAFELGAAFVTVKEHVASIRESAGVAIADDRFIIVDGSGSVAGGKARVVDFPSGHTSHMLLSYFPDAKIAFTADTFFSRQEAGSPNGYEGLNAFKKVFADNNLDAQYFAAAHSGRVLTAADLDAAINNIREDAVCPADWAFCME